MIYEFYACSDVEGTQETLTKFVLDDEQKTLTKVAGYTGVDHPRYMAFNGDKSVLYAIQSEETEGEEGALYALTVRPGDPETGTTDLVPADMEGVTESLPDELQIKRTLSTKGTDPCHVSVSENDRWVYVSDYAGGSLSVFPLNEEGIPEDRPQIIQDEGPGQGSDRQDGPHMCSAYEKEGLVYLVDLGLDTVDVYEPSEDDPELLEDSGLEYKLQKGSGPAKLVFLDDYLPELYILCELSSQIQIWVMEHGTWRLADKWPTKPESFFRENTPTSIKRDRNMLFVTNKGDDSIAVYRIINYGFLERTQIIKSGGESPQDMIIVGDYLVVANADSDLLSVFYINWKETKVEATDMKLELARPTCLAGYRVPEEPYVLKTEEEQEEEEEQQKWDPDSWDDDEEDSEEEDEKSKTPGIEDKISD